ncbi:MAG TPA: hypothetical protein VFR58_14670 [Flavisolibacter sp.]|nr:hypothetical protein [Flavisolibacter sp.]
MSKQQKPNKNNDLLRYAGLGGQIFVSLGLSVWLGLKADQWFGLPFPLLVWLFPLAVLTMMILKLIRDSSKKKKNDPD